MVFHVTVSVTSWIAQRGSGSQHRNSREGLVWRRQIGLSQLTLETLGEGGMGTVYEAEQDQSHRMVGSATRWNGRDNFETQANYLLAGNPKGKLLLIHGDMTRTCIPR